MILGYFDFLRGEDTGLEKTEALALSEGLSNGTNLTLRVTVSVMLQH